MNYKIYEQQVEAIYRKTEEEIRNKNDMSLYGALAMFKIMINSISSYVLTKASKDPAFDESLALPHKSAERLFKHIWGNAKKRSVSIGNGSGCCVPDEVVYRWIEQYYALDDKEAVEEELRKAAEAQAKKEEEKKKEEARKIKAREKAIAKLSSETENWEELSEDEKESLIKKTSSSIEYELKKADERKSKPKKESKSKTKKTKKLEQTADDLEDETNNSEENKDVISNIDSVENDTTEDIPENSSDITEEEATINNMETESVNTDSSNVISEEIEAGEQFSLFDLMKG